LNRILVPERASEFLLDLLERGRPAGTLVQEGEDALLFVASGVDLGEGDPLGILLRAVVGALERGERQQKGGDPHAI